MSKTIKTPETVQELFRLAHSLDMSASEVLYLLDDALGENWWDREPEEFTTISPAAPPVAPATVEATRPATPAPGTIPPGFTKAEEIDWYEGKRMDGERWTVRSEWNPNTGEFWLAFWTHDDDAMTSAEARDYAGAMLTMGAYITTMGNVMATGVEAGK